MMHSICSIRLFIGLLMSTIPTVNSINTHLRLLPSSDSADIPIYSFPPHYSHQSDDNSNGYDSNEFNPLHWSPKSQRPHTSTQFPSVQPGKGSSNLRDGSKDKNQVDLVESGEEINNSAQLFDDSSSIGNNAVSKPQVDKNYIGSVSLPQPSISNCPKNGDSPISVEGVYEYFCVPNGNMCSGRNTNGFCPGIQAGLPQGSHCTEVRPNVFGCRRGSATSSEEILDP